MTLQRALVTGATGFIGARLVEKLLERGVAVRALVKNFTHASRLARYPVEMVPGAIADPEAVDNAVAGCDVVFHCAHDFDRPDDNLAGARALAMSCVCHGVQRLVHVSSISVYEPLPDGEVDESTPAVPCGWTYPDNKLAIEELLLRFGATEGLPTVVLQPTIVYGPYSRPWTLSPVTKLRSGRVVLPSDRDGCCNAVYVDDVADALLLAAERDDAAGERFLISGPDSVRWSQFYAAYERMLGTHSIVGMTTAEIERLNGKKPVSSTLWLVGQDPRRLLQWTPLRNAYEKARVRFISERVVQRAKRTLPSSLYLPNPAQLALYRAAAVVNIDKARRRLGYSPRFGFDRGMARTAKYVAWANL